MQLPMRGDLPANGPGGDVPFATTLVCARSLPLSACAAGRRALARRFDDALRPVDLTNGQFSLLMSLNRPAAGGDGIGCQSARHGPHHADRRVEAAGAARAAHRSVSIRRISAAGF